MDLALVAHAATLEARVPFLHFFDGFRTSHEVAKIEPLDDDDLRALSTTSWCARTAPARSRPTIPSIRGTAQNPDVYFQAREAVNPYYLACPAIVQDAMDGARARAPAAATACSTTSARPTPSASSS